jgi:hypothetical protein
MAKYCALKGETEESMRKTLEEMGKDLTNVKTPKEVRTLYCINVCETGAGDCSL